MDELENKLNEYLVKKAPFQIPENARKPIAEYAWLIALGFVVISAFGFIPLLTAVGILSTIGVALGATWHALMAWVSLLVLLGTLVIICMAVPKLRLKQKTGWDLMYYGILLNFAYGTINSLRLHPLLVPLSILWGVAWTTALLYVLFQVRSKFKN